MFFYNCINSNDRKIITMFLWLFFFFTLANIIISCALFFGSHYPDSYTWTELYINYEGGFIRRGLIGQVIFFMSHLLGVKTSTIILFLPAYISFVYLSIIYFYKNTDSLTFILIITSPGLLFFFAQDRGMLCRKDIFFELGFLLQFMLLASKRLKIFYLFVLIVVIFLICLLIHESTIFYTILPFTIFLEQAYKRKIFTPYFFALCIIALFSLWYLTSFPGTMLQHDKIINSWSEFFTLSREGALRFIGKSMATKIAEEKNFYNSIALGYFLFGLVLTSYPLCHYVKKISFFSRINKYFCFKFNKLLVVVGCIFPWILPFIAVDFGRHIHTGVFYLFTFCATIVSLTGKIKEENNKKFNKLFFMFLFFYIFGWKMWLYAEDARFLSLSFPIRAFQIGWVPSLDP